MYIYLPHSYNIKLTTTTHKQTNMNLNNHGKKILKIIFLIIMNIMIIMCNNMIYGATFNNYNNNNRDNQYENTKHKSNYAIIVSTSRYWFNYRHNA